MEGRSFVVFVRILSQLLFKIRRAKVLASPSHLGATIF
jgi:hypothetical protein